MRALVDIVDSVTGVIRHGISAIMLFGLVMSLLVTGCVAFMVPSYEEQRAEKARIQAQAAEKMQQAEAEALRSQREAALAKDGWGYGSLDGSDASAGDWDETPRRRKRR